MTLSVHESYSSIAVLNGICVQHYRHDTVAIWELFIFSNGLFWHTQKTFICPALRCCSIIWLIYIVLFLSTNLQWMAYNGSNWYLANYSAPCDNYCVQAAETGIHHSSKHILATQRYCSENTWSSPPWELWTISTSPRRCFSVQVLSRTGDNSW